jgi:two-component system, NtrC family, sensor kinase
MTRRSTTQRPASGGRRKTAAPRAAKSLKIKGKPAKGGLRAPAPEEVLAAALEIGRASVVDLGAVDLGAEFLRILTSILPERSVAVRLIDPRTLALRAMESVGGLKAGAYRAPLGLKASAIRRTRLPETITLSGRVEVHGRYQTIFEETEGGFAVPVAAGGELYGLINLEWPEGSGTAAQLGADEAVVLPLANQLACAMRNLELLADAKRSQEYLEQIVARAKVYIGVARRDGSLALANDGFLRYLGLSADGMATVSVQRWVAAHPNVPEPRLGMLTMRALAGEEIETIDAYGARSDGVIQRATWSLTPLRDPSGVVESVIIVGHDLERIRQLERQVIQSEKLATLGQLAAGVVHELNNPLTSIGVYAEYRARRLEPHDPGDAEKARRILDGAGRIQKLTQDLVSYARPAGERAPVDLNAVVAQALSFCEHVLTEAEARLEASYDPALPRVLGIKGPLQQVFINLITNACHAVADRAGSGRVRVATGRGPGGSVVVSIRDDGGGIPTPHRERIFEPFFTTKSEGKGTGLGLSIVKNIIEAHGGIVSFESDPAGTTFTVVLPPQPGTTQG